MSSFRNRCLRAARLTAVAVAAATVVSCASAGGPQSAARSGQPSDEVLQTRVSQALVAQSGVPAKEITVTVTGGVVNLSGAVGTYNDLLNLGAVVRAVPGVREVRFAVAVKPAEKGP